jgi:hypothetical protein
MAQPATHLTLALDKHGKVCSGCFTPRERNPDTHLTGGYAGPAAHLNTVETRKYPPPASNQTPVPHSPSPQHKAHFVSNISLYFGTAAESLITFVSTLCFELSWRKIAIVLYLPATVSLNGLLWYFLL